MRVPRVFGVPAGGEIELERLAPGPWTWNLFAVASRDLHVLFDPSSAPAHLAQGHVELIEGATAEVVLAPRNGARSARGGTAGLVGEVRVDGAPARDLRVTLVPLQDQVDESSVDDAPSGTFEFRDLAPGPYVLLAEPDGEPGVLLVQERVDLAAGEVREVAYDVALRALELTVRAPGGAPAAGARVTVTTSPTGAAGHGGYLASAEADADGRARVRVASAGPYRVIATHPEHGAARGELGDAAPLELELAPGVECAGTLRFLELPPRAAPREEPEALSPLIARSDADPNFVVTCAVAPEDGAAFRLRGLAPGRYHVELWCGEVPLRATLELPEAGARALELWLEPGR
jgi:hypothetical protein